MLIQNEPRTEKNTHTENKMANVREQKNNTASGLELCMV